MLRRYLSALEPMALRELRWLLDPSMRRYAEGLAAADKAAQLQLALRYGQLVERQDPLPALADVEFRAFSQAGEDGILLFLFSVLGTTDRRVVEICAGNGLECNSANLLINHGWTGLLVDGDERNVQVGRSFYARCPDTKIWPPTFVHSWVSAENVNDLITEHGFAGEIDLLSIDVDGMDYWVWNAINCVRPRVVVIEVQSLWGPDVSVTVPYDPRFRAEFTAYGPNYAGASLAALVKLGKQKGYRLIGCQRYGYNAFFLRDDVGRGTFAEAAPTDCLTHPHAKFGLEVRRETVMHRDWQSI